MSAPSQKAPQPIDSPAVVVGGSMAGLCAARVLADRFDRVVVIDRDTLPEGPDARGQVPQGRHPHLLLPAGAWLLERWFPGIAEELEAGMTSAALQAVALGECLDRAKAIDGRFAKRYFKAAGKVVAVPWSIAVGGDFAYDGTTGKKPAGTDFLNRYTEKVTIAAMHDAAVALRFNEVVALVRRPESLLTPRFWWRVRRLARRGPVAVVAEEVAARS